MSLRNTIGAIAALLLSFIIPVVAAAGPLAMTLATSKRKFDVTIYPSPGTASRPVVLVFSGAKGYEAAAYHRLAEDLNFAGIDVAADPISVRTGHDRNRACVLRKSANCILCEANAGLGGNGSRNHRHPP